MAVNIAVIGGYMHNEPSFSYTDKHKAMCKFTLCISNGFGADKNLAVYVPCVCFGRIAEVCSAYTKRGSRVLVQGVLKDSSYIDSKGVKHETMNVIANSVQLLSAQPKAHEEKKRIEQARAALGGMPPSGVPLGMKEENIEPMNDIDFD